MVAVAAVCAFFGGAPAAVAAPPDPDPAFGQSGFVLSSLGGTNFAAISDVAVQPDGKIVVAGTADMATTGFLAPINQFAVARFLPTGALDTTFNTSGPTPGVHVTPLDPSGSHASSIAVLASGEIVAAGTYGAAESATAVVQRFTSSGTLDAGFASSGRFSSRFGQTAAHLYDVVVRGDGRVVVVGEIRAGSDRRALLAQLTSTGALDASFAQSGVRIQQLGARVSRLAAASLDAGDRLITAGASDGQVLYARWSATGSLENKGTALFAELAGAQALVLHAGGRVTVAGFSSDGRGEFNVSLARFESDGALAADFGAPATPGRATHSIGNRIASVGGMTLLPGGALRVAGSVLDGAHTKGFVAQYTNAGNPDTAFDEAHGSNHRLYAFGDGGPTGFAAISLLPSGRYLVAGHATTGATQRALLARLGGTAQSPVAAFSVFAFRPLGKPIRPGRSVAFDAAASDDADGEIVRYEWDLDGDGNFETIGPKAARTYDTEGDYPVTLRVTDGEGLVGQLTKVVHIVANAYPNATLKKGAAGNPRYGQPFELTAAGSQDSDGSVVRYEWATDDKPGFDVDTGSKPTLSWRPWRVGPQTLRVRVTDDEGASHEAGLVVDVMAPSFDLVPTYITKHSGDTLLLKKGQTGKVLIHVKGGPGASGPYTHSAQVIGSPGFKVELTGVFGVEGEQDRVLHVTAPKGGDSNATLIRVRVVSSPLEGSVVRELLVAVDVPELNPQSDPRVIGIELNQGIQKESEPCDLQAVTPPNLLPPDVTEVSKELCTRNRSLREPQKAPFKLGNRSFRWAPYAGVELVRSKKTVVRVFANTAFGQASGYTAVLHAYTSSGKEFKNSPISPLTTPKNLMPGRPYVTFQHRTDPKAAMAFVLPESWTRKNPMLEAELVPTQSSKNTPACTTAECKANDRLALIGGFNLGIPFTNTGYIRVGTAQVKILGTLPAAPGGLFRLADKWAPLKDDGLRYNRKQWYATVELPANFFTEHEGDEVGEVRDFIDDYADDENDNNGCGGDEFCADQVVGVEASPKVCCGTSMGGIVNSVSDPVGVANNVPETVVHELFHGWGETPHTFSVKSCISNPDQMDQLGEASDASGLGKLEGIGIDTTGTGDPSAPFRIIAPGALGAPPGVPGGDPQQPWYFDVLSYCNAGPAQRWISVGGWKRLLELAREIVSDFNRYEAPTAQPPRNVLRVQAPLARDGSIEIRTVKPREGRQVREHRSAFTLRALGSAGQTLSQAPMTLRPATDDADGLLIGEVAADGAVAVAVIRDGAEVARRSASANAPRIRLLTRRKGQVVRRDTSLSVRWRASDADGDRLLAKIEYSTDEGRVWRVLAVAPASRGFTKIPSAALTGSKRARIRIRVHDGFREAEARSERFTVLANRPSVQIVNAASRAVRSPLGAPAYLSGIASDEHGRPITGRALRWLAGKRTLGTGAQISVAGLPTGRHTIRLIARDRRGRNATATGVLHVTPARPLFLKLTAPKTARRTARSVMLRVASNVPATLRVANRRYRVSTRPRRITVPVKRGRQRLVLSLKLASGRLVSTRTVTITRR